SRNLIRFRAQPARELQPLVAAHDLQPNRLIGSGKRDALRQGITIDQRLSFEFDQPITNLDPDFSSRAVWIHVAHYDSWIKSGIVPGQNAQERPAIRID